MVHLNRREFVVAAASAACASCLCEFAHAEPTPPSQSTGPVDVGAKADYAKDGFINDKLTKTDRIVVVRNEGKIYAFNSTCTHRNAAVRQVNGEIVCPSHGSHYSINGTVTKGPAKRSLLRYGISLDDKGHLIVDKSKQFEEKHWDDEGASVAV